MTEYKHYEAVRTFHAITSHRNLRADYRSINTSPFVSRTWPTSNLRLLLNQLPKRSRLLKISGIHGRLPILDISFDGQSTISPGWSSTSLISISDPDRIALAYTTDSIWRNRTTFLTGRQSIIEFLNQKWNKEQSYRLRKEFFSFTDNKIAVQFWYEYQDATDGMKWKRCYGLEDWTYDAEGKMRKRMMSGNDLEITEEERWFVDGVDVDDSVISEKHW